MKKNPFLGLDGIELIPGDRVVASTSYPGSEVEHYHGLHGSVHSQLIDTLKTPLVAVVLDSLPRPVLFYPYELTHEEG